MNVARIMTTSVSTCGSGDTLDRAAKLMWDERRGCLPVLGKSGEVVGILTDRDVAMAAYTQGRPLGDIKVDVAMSHPVHTCLPTATIEEVEDLMMAHGLRRVVVVDAFDQLQGIVSIDDLARCGAAWDGDGDIDLERVTLALGEISRRTTPADEEPPELPENDVTEFVLNSLEALKTLRKELRVDLDLAGREVRHRLRRLGRAIHLRGGAKMGLAPRRSAH